MRSRYYYIRRLLNVDVVDDDGGDNDSPRNTRSSSSRMSPLSSSSSTVENPPFKPTLGFDSSMALTILILLSALFFMVFFSMYLRRFAADDNSITVSRRRRRQLQSTTSSSSSSSIAAAAAAAAIVAARFDASSSFSSSNGLDPSTIRSLPLYSYDGNGNGNGNDEDEPILCCSVCLSEFEEKETMKVIPYCGHAFHPQCIDRWFYSHSSCPLCRSTQLFRDGSSSGSTTAANVKEEVTEMKMKKDCLVVETSVLSSQKRFYSEHNNHRIVINECGESLGKSTVVSGGDTSGSGGLRRISSWSGLDEKVLLKRSLSF